LYFGNLKPINNNAIKEKYEDTKDVNRGRTDNIMTKNKDNLTNKNRKQKTKD